MYHDLLFESAETVFGARGFGGATMEKIAKEAGVSLKTLYVTYPSKQDLYDEVMRVRATEFLEQTAAAIEGVDDPLEQIRCGITAYVAFLLEHEDWLQIHLRGRIAWSFRPRGENAADAWAEGLDGYARVIAKGQEQGVFVEGDPAELSMLAQALMQVQMARAMELEERAVEGVADSIVVHVFRLLGVAPEHAVGASPVRGAATSEP